MKNVIRSIVPFSLLVALALFSCEEQAEVRLDDQIPTIQPTPTSTCTIGPDDHLCRTRDLIAGQNYVVGTVKVYCTDGTNDYKVVFEVDPDCSISEVNVYAGPLSEIPKNRGGCPQIGNFPFKLGGLSTTSVCVDVGTIPGAFTVAAHAVVSCSGSPFDGEETAWGDGKRFPECNNWSLCFGVDCKKTVAD